MNPSPTSGVISPISTQQHHEKEPWEMNKNERIAHAMKIRAESESAGEIKTIADLFGNLKK